MHVILVGWCGEVRRRVVGRAGVDHRDFVCGRVVPHGEDAEGIMKASVGLRNAEIARSASVRRIMWIPCLSNKVSAEGGDETGKPSVRNKVVSSTQSNNICNTL